MLSNSEVHEIWQVGHQQIHNSRYPVVMYVFVNYFVLNLATLFDRHSQNNIEALPILNYLHNSEVLI